MGSNKGAHVGRITGVPIKHKLPTRFFIAPGIRVDSGLKTGRTFRLRLTPQNGSLPRFKPGQSIRLSLPGYGILSMRRSFTIASSPWETRYLELIVKDTGEWSGTLKTLVSSRTEPIQAVIAGPYGRFTCEGLGGTGRFVFLAGGIGGVPFISMLEHASRFASEDRILFLWGAGTRDDLFGMETITTATAKIPGFRFVPVLSRDPLWTGERGRIDGDKLLRIVPAFFGANTDNFEWNSASFWLCGPESFRRDLKKTLKSLKVHHAAVHEERFSH